MRALCAALAALACGISPADAQVRAGVSGVYETGVFEGTYGVGGRAEFGLDFLTRGLAVAGTYDHFFPGCADCSSANAGVQIVMAPPSPLYLGVGANLSRFNDGQSDQAADSDWAMNLIVGVRFSVLPVVRPFFEFRQEILSRDINAQTLSLGVLFSPARARNAPPRARSR